MQISHRGKKMQFHCASCQGVNKSNENKKEFKMVRCLVVPDIVSNLNGCIPLYGGQEQKIMWVAKDVQCLNWHIPLGGSTCLCAIEFHLISNFIWFGCYKAGIYLVVMEFEILVQV
jgi:hypothetical protein